MAKHYSHWTEAASDFRNRGEAFVLVTLLEVKGSAPRDIGTKMLVSINELVGTIGGGHLEHSVIAKARELLTIKGDHQHIEQYPLGPRLGQCCGGRVTVLFECFNQAAAQVVLFGAGHVGRALISILSQLPIKVTWVDSRADEFPTEIPAGVNQLISDEPEQEVKNFNPGAFYIVMTHLHPLDYAITETVLKRNDAAFLGVIGSQTKAKRFQMRLQHRGFTQEAVNFMQCPVGLNAVPGKHPMEVAVSVAAQVIAAYHHDQHAQPTIARSGMKLLELISNDGQQS